MNTQKIPARLIPKLPNGAKPFEDYQLVRQRIPTTHDVIRIYGEDCFDIDTLINRLQLAKKVVAKNLGCTLDKLPEVVLEGAGEEYEGWDRFDVVTYREETDKEVKARLNKLAKRKIDSYNRAIARKQQQK